MKPKFRAWDKERNEMNYKVMVGNCDTDDENWTCPIIWIEERQDWLHFDDYDSIMQSTGLLDKNGKEVFIGDIIKCTRGCLHEVYIEKEYGGTYFGGMPAVYLKGLREGYAWTEYEEIVGNIYENPELLEEQK
ncbi:YopX family protein [Streptococcus sp. Marseille-P8640]|uniref:YopX family protein n=1 Tax=Streptococcus sp. Marseille-P8640 TaxID=2866596 RepID=UPI0023B8DF42|nr:YopX family protein [Streptococcus sp. Marseille-P8640]